MQIRQREFEEKKKLFESLQNGKPVVAAARCLEDEEDEEAEPDLEIQVPKHKVKLIIGPGGENIKQIQRRTRTRIQVHSIILILAAVLMSSLCQLCSHQQPTARMLCLT
jgi:predicted PilT family ATPase